MGRLIDVDEIPFFVEEDGAVVAYKADIEQIPSVQPEIIRCKDCKHSFLHNNGERTSRICGRTRMCGTTPDDWYCGDAERRTDGMVSI